MRKLLFAVALALIAVAAVVVPLPLLVVAPGGVVSVPAHVDIEGPPGAINGEVLLTTVSLHQSGAVGAIAALVDDDRDVIWRQRVIPPGVDEEEFVRAQQRLFEESSRVAVAVGARTAGADVEISGDGARVAGVVTGGPADGELREGDVIVEIDGEPVEVAADLVAVTSRADVGDTVVLRVERGDEHHTAEIELGEVGRLERPALGVTVQTVGLDIDIPRTVDIDSGRIGGPSAGLMIAVASYDLFSDVDLAAGRVIAGTGTIDVHGRVGSVAGVRQKVQAARDAGADIFLVGERELDDARAAAGSDLQVVGVATLDDAVAALRR